MDSGTPNRHHDHRARLDTDVTSPSAASASTSNGDDSPPAIVSPPYWQTSHTRQFSTGSVDLLRPAPIALEDHEELGSETSKALWAKHVTIDEYVVVSGNAAARAGLGAYFVWNCTVETLDVSVTNSSLVSMHWKSEIQV